MADENKRKLRLTTIVFWVLLLYIIAALIWWFLSLNQQNEQMYQLRRQELYMMYNPASAEYRDLLHKAEDIRSRGRAKYIGEGSTFLVLILIGALFVFRSVRRQFKFQRQQQNFVMAITHELKTPIAVSRLNLETLLKYQLAEEKKVKMLQMTLQETLRLDTLINNILLASQLDVHSYKLSREELDFSHLSRDIATQFANRYPDRPFTPSIEDDVDVEGDTLLLKLLLSNLLENANKYSPREKPITFSLGKKDGWAVLQVMDEGAGIPNEEKKNIFEKFYRIGSEQTRKTQGTGLGLYLCKKIVEDHKGTITVEDNKPQGSNFIVRIPINA